jgi:TetR/AcrR family transcriptional repressor of nem operon
MNRTASARRKDASHQRILHVAARLVREEGFAGAAVDLVMGEAGLTRGGFYAHFRDKDGMLVEALGVAFDQARRNLFDVEPATGDGWLARASARYANRAHVEALGDGCAVAALGGEVARSSAPVREAFDRHVGEIIDEMARRLAGGRATAASRRRAIEVFTRWVGSVLVARSVGRTLGDEVLDTVRSATGPRRAGARQVAAKGLSSKGARAKSSAALPASTPASASSDRPARARARTSRSHA